MSRKANLTLRDVHGLLTEGEKTGFRFGLLALSLSLSLSLSLYIYIYIYRDCEQVDHYDTNQMDVLT